MTMKNYFSIPNLMVFSNMTQEGGRVIKGSAVMGFSLDPKECLDNAAGDLQMMGCSLFYKMSQEVVIGHGIGGKVSQLKWRDSLKASRWSK